MSASRFTSLDVRKVGDKDWLMLAPLVMLVVVDGVSYLIRVPPGFITDFASVPRIPLAFWLFGGIGDYAAAVHDWLYTSGEYPRDICDKLFREILHHVDGTSWARAEAMYRAVRLAGGSRYTARQASDSARLALNHHRAVADR